MLYNNDNSNIETIFPGSKITNPNEYYFYHRVDGLIFDKSNNLLLLNMGVSSTVKYMTPDPDSEESPSSIVKNLPYADIKDVSTAQDILISEAIQITNGFPFHVQVAVKQPFSHSTITVRMKI